MFLPERLRYDGALMNAEPNSQDSRSLPRLSYNRHEAAEILGVSVESVDRLVVRGLLKPSRALRRPLFSTAELERFLASTQV